MEFEYIFRISLAASFILFLLLIGLTFTLVVLKSVRGFLRGYSKNRQTFYLPLILQAIAAKSATSFISEYRRNKRPGDREIIEKALIKWSASIKGHGQEGLARVFAEGGFGERNKVALRSFFWWRRAQAAFRIGRMYYSPAAGDLHRLLSDHVMEVRLTACWAMARLGKYEVVGDMVRSLARDSKFVVIRLMRIIMEMGPETLPMLQRLMKTPDPEVRLLAINLMGAIKDARVIGDLLPCLKVRDMEINIAAIRAVADLGDSAAGVHVMPLLDHARWPVRAQAAVCMRRLKYVPAIPLLRENLSDINWWVRVNSGEALVHMGAAGRRALEEVRDGGNQIPKEMAVHWLGEWEVGLV